MFSVSCFKFSLSISLTSFFSFTLIIKFYSQFFYNKKIGINDCDCFYQVATVAVHVIKN